MKSSIGIMSCWNNMKIKSRILKRLFSRCMLANMDLKGGQIMDNQLDIVDNKAVINREEEIEGKSLKAVDSVLRKISTNQNQKCDWKRIDLVNF